MNRTARVATLLPLALLACGSDSDSGQPGGCTDMGCSDGLSVSFVSPAWPPGAYRLDVTADGLDYHCETALPFTSERPSVCNSADVALEVSGSALPADQHAISGMRLRPLAENITVTLSRDGLPLATENFYPTYETVQPNGPDCGPTCTAAHASMSL